MVSRRSVQTPASPSERSASLCREPLARTSSSSPASLSAQLPRRGHFWAVALRSGALVSTCRAEVREESRIEHGGIDKLALHGVASALAKVRIPTRTKALNHLVERFGAFMQCGPSPVCEGGESGACHQLRESAKAPFPEVLADLHPGSITAQHRHDCLEFRQPSRKPRHGRQRPTSPHDVNCVSPTWGTTIPSPTVSAAKSEGSTKDLIRLKNSTKAASGISTMSLSRRSFRSRFEQNAFIFCQVGRQLPQQRHGPTQATEPSACPPVSLAKAPSR